ncbi:MAG: RNA pyrophosphohydrolase [Thioploca sp.]|nr:RNA pyrophosphohydrolase [Thioploca sp.]
MIDTDGYRMNVGIILTNQQGQVLWAKRIGQDAWQFPQGGIKAHETPKRALFRELHEELGLTAKQVQVLGATRGWLRYRLPEHLIRYHQQPLCIGQKQVWYMLRLLANNRDIQLNLSKEPEFEEWLWVDYWYPLTEVVYFKKRVYEIALKELQTFVSPSSKKIILRPVSSNNSPTLSPPSLPVRELNKPTRPKSLGLKS